MELILVASEVRLVSEPGIRTKVSQRVQTEGGAWSTEPSRGQCTKGNLREKEPTYIIAGNMAPSPLCPGAPEFWPSNLIPLK